MRTVPFDGLGVFDLAPGYYVAGGEPMAAYDVYDLPGPCASRCVFCLESRFEPRPPPPIRPRRRRAILCRWEPTGLADLPGVVRALKERYESVLVATNGRRLDARLARALAAAGLDELVVSVHGPAAAVHDALTRAPGSFAETLAGLRAAAEAGLPRIGVHTVLARANAGLLAEVLDLSAALGARALVVSPIVPLGEGARALAAHGLRLDEAFAAFAALARARPEPRRPVCLPHFPPCAARGPAADAMAVALTPRGGDFDVLGAAGWKARCDACGWSAHCEGMLAAYAPKRSRGERDG